MKLSHGMKSDIGRVRLTNEDCCFASDEMGLFIVADGMGGHAGGRIASKDAVTALADFVGHYLRNPDITPPFGLAMDLSGPESVLRAAMMVANARVLERSKRDASLSGMGTTLSVCWVRGRSAHIAHVGDSRVYLIRDSSFRLLTQDHSWVYEQYREGILSFEETKSHPMKHLVTRSLGAKKTLQADLHSYALQDNDLIMLCTDGLTSVLADELIQSAVLDPAVSALDQKCHVLVEMVNQAGGFDNTTVVLVRVQDAKS